MKKKAPTIRDDFEQLMAEWKAGLLGPSSGLCEVIRTTVSLHPGEPLGSFIKALPECNASTLRIQFNNSRRVDAALQ